MKTYKRKLFETLTHKGERMKNLILESHTFLYSKEIYVRKDMQLFLSLMLVAVKNEAIHVERNEML